MVGTAKSSRHSRAYHDGGAGLDVIANALQVQREVRIDLLPCVPAPAAHTPASSCVRGRGTARAAAGVPVLLSTRLLLSLTPTHPATTPCLPLPLPLQLLLLLVRELLLVHMGWQLSSACERSVAVALHHLHLLHLHGQHGAAVAVTVVDAAAAVHVAPVVVVRRHGALLALRTTTTATSSVLVVVARPRVAPAVPIIVVVAHLALLLLLLLSGRSACHQKYLISKLKIINTENSQNRHIMFSPCVLGSTCRRAFRSE